MTINILDQLIEFYKEDPSDPFNVYSLATEYLKYDVKQSESYFEILLRDFPEYLPTYYHAAALYFETGKIVKANDTYLKGIEIAQNQNKIKLGSELKAAYQNFLFETED